MQKIPMTYGIKTPPQTEGKKNEHFRKAGKFIRKIKKQKHPQKMLVNMAIDEVTKGMKETMPKYMRLKNGMVINLHDMLA